MTLTQAEIDALAVSMAKLAEESQTAAGTSASATISAVALKLPPFWNAEPELWFKQVEAQFQTRKIFNDKAKFNHVIQTLDNAAASEVESIIMNPPDDHAYVALKESLIKSYGKSQDEKDNELLNLHGLGDRKPTALLRHIQSLNSDPATLLRVIFLKELPDNVRSTLAASGEKDLQKLAAMADSMMEASKIQSNHPPQVYAAQVSASSAPRSTAPAFGARPPLRPQTAPGTANSKLCYFHAKFGAKAHKCAKTTCPMRDTVSVSSAQAVPTPTAEENFLAGLKM